VTADIDEIVEEKESKVVELPLTMSRDDLMSLTIPMLKDKLREAGKPVSGNKPDLVDRLLST